MTGKAKAGLRKRSFACLALGARSAFSGRAAGPGILLFALAFLPFFAALSSTPPPPPLLGESQLLNDIDEAITFHETKTQSQAHITFWKNVRSAIVAEAVPDSLKTEFDQRAGGAKPGGKFYQLYMDVKAEFERILTPPPIPAATLSASPETIELGQPSTLTWSTENADTVTLDQIAVSSSGSKVVSPVATTHYYLVASGEGGSTQATVTLEVTLPVLQQSEGSQESDQNTQQSAGWVDASDIVIEEGGYLQQEDFAIVLGAGDTSAQVTGSPWPGYAGAPYPERYVGTKTYGAGDYVIYLRSGVNRIFRRRTSGSDGNTKGPLFSTNKGNWEETTPYDGNGVAHGFGIVPMHWPDPGYITIRSFGSSGTQEDNYPEFCSANQDANSACGAGAPIWRVRPESFNTDGTGNAKMSIEVNTVDDNIVQADRVHSLELSIFGNKVGTKRIVIKEDDFWRAQVEVKGGHGGAGRCLAWAACLQGPSPQENRYTIRSGIEFGQPGYDPNAAVTGCRYDLWDKRSACTKTTGGSGPKRLVIQTGGPMGIAKGLDGPAGGDHYDVGGSGGGYYWSNGFWLLDGNGDRMTTVQNVSNLPAYIAQITASCEGAACGAETVKTNSSYTPALIAYLTEPYDTIVVPESVLTGGHPDDQFAKFFPDNRLVSDCSKGSAVITFELGFSPGSAVGEGAANYEYGKILEAMGVDSIPWPSKDRIQFTPASINWCR